MNFTSDNNIEQFRCRLADTIAWCSSHDWVADPAKDLRTAQLRPLELSTMESMLLAKNHQLEKIVEQLAMKRTVFLQEQGVSLILPVPSLANGRLLAFNPGGSTTDGALYNSTEGFIDTYNIPAWDTWIFYVTNDPVSNLPWWQGCDSYLLSWVPDALVEGVEAGISVNSDDCVRWAKDLDAAFIWRLKQAGCTL